MSEDLGSIVWSADINTDGLTGSTSVITRSTKQAEKGFDRTEKSVVRTEKSMLSLSRVAKSLAGALAIRQLNNYVLSTAQAIDTQNNFAKSIGITYENLQRLQFVTAQNGASQSELNNSLRRLTRRSEEAANGVGAGVEAFKMLGIEAKELKGLSPDEIFLRVADSFQNLKTSGEQTRVAFGLFDTEGAKLINTLRQGRSYIEATGSSITNLISDDAAKAAADFNSELDKLKQAAGGAGAELATSFLPIITETISRFTEFVSDGEKVEKAIELVGYAAQATAVILAGRFVGSLVTSASAMNTATIASRALVGSFALLGGPVGVIFAAIAAGALLANQLAKTTQKIETQIQPVDELAEAYKKLTKEELDNIRAKNMAEQASLEQDKKRIELALELAKIRNEEAKAAPVKRGMGVSEAVEISKSAEEVRKLEADLQHVDATLETIKNSAAAIDLTLFERGMPDKWIDDLDDAEEKLTAIGEKAEETISGLALRNEEMRAALAGTNEELEIRRALSAAGVEAGTAEAAVIENLIRGNNELTEAIRAQTEERNRIQELESVVSSDLGLTRIQALEQRYAAERDLLLEAQEAGIESEISYQERLTEIERQYSEERKQIAIDEAESRKLISGQLETTLGAMGDMFGNFANAAREGGKDSFKAYKLMAIAQATISTFLAANNALATPAPFPMPEILAASIGALGLANVAKIKGMQYGGGRRYGGSVDAGKFYEVGESNTPEIFKSGAKQYLVPGNRGGDVVSGKNAFGGGDTNVTLDMDFTITGDATENTVEMIRNAIFDSELDLVEAVQRGMNMTGRNLL